MVPINLTLEDLQKTKLCAQLWTNASIEVTGNSAICCNMFFKEPQTDDNIHTSSVLSFLHTSKMQELRKKMLCGEEPEECQTCFEKERNGISSIRNYKNDMHFKNNSLFKIDEISLQNLELQFGNICQLRCIMCSPARSKAINGFYNFNDQKNGKAGFNFPASTWQNDDSIVVNIADQCSDVHEIFINGGEPLLVSTHNDFLNRLIDLGFAKNITLKYATNGLLITEDHFKLWEHFKGLELILSIDEILDRYHFIRYPGNWSKMESKLKLAYDNFEKIQAKSPKSYIGLHLVLTFLNFLYLDEFLEYFRSNFPKIVINFSGIQYPKELSAKNLPIYLKTEIGKKIKSTIIKHNLCLDGRLIREIDVILSSPPIVEEFNAGVQFVRNFEDYYSLDLEGAFPNITPALKAIN